LSREKLIIRNFAATDLPSLQQIRREAFAPIFESFREITGPDVAEFALAEADEDQAKLLEDMCAQDSAWAMLVAVLADEAVGFAAYSIDSAKGLGEIGLNCVRPRFAGRGIGTALYSEALERMRGGGVKVATVGTGGIPATPRHGGLMRRSGSATPFRP
jgi:ribosomal protein S18 acetylase RimI-like enzyme